MFSEDNVSVFVFKYPSKWCTYSAGMAGATWNCCCFGAFCVHHTTMHHMSLHAKPHTLGACVFSCNLPPALLAEWPGSFTCYCGNTKVERIPKYKSAQKVTPGEKNTPSLLQGFKSATFQTRVLRYNHWVIPAPNCTHTRLRTILFDRPLTKMYCQFCDILTEILSRSHAKGGSLNDFKFGTSIGRFSTDGATSWAVKGLSV